MAGQVEHESTQAMRHDTAVADDRPQETCLEQEGASESSQRPASDGELCISVQLEAEQLLTFLAGFDPNKRAFENFSVIQKPTREAASAMTNAKELQEAIATSVDNLALAHKQLDDIHDEAERKAKQALTPKDLDVLDLAFKSLELVTGVHGALKAGLGAARALYSSYQAYGEASRALATLRQDVLPGSADAGILAGLTAEARQQAIEALAGQVGPVNGIIKSLKVSQAQLDQLKGSNPNASIARAVEAGMEASRRVSDVLAGLANDQLKTQLVNCTNYLRQGADSIVAFFDGLQNTARIGRIFEPEMLEQEQLDEKIANAIEQRGRLELEMRKMSSLLDAIKHDTAAQLVKGTKSRSFFDVLNAWFQGDHSRASTGLDKIRLVALVPHVAVTLNEETSGQYFLLRGKSTTSTPRFALDVGQASLAAGDDAQLVKHPSIPELRLIDEAYFDLLMKMFPLTRTTATDANGEYEQVAGNLLVDLDVMVSGGHRLETRLPVATASLTTDWVNDPHVISQLASLVGQSTTPDAAKQPFMMVSIVDDVAGPVKAIHDLAGARPMAADTAQGALP